MEKLTDLANKSDEFKHGYCNGRIDEEYLWKCKIKAKIGKRMQKNNNTIHNAKLKHGKDYVYYDDVQEAKEENRICKEILQSLLEKE